MVPFTRAPFWVPIFDPHPNPTITTSGRGALAVPSARLEQLPDDRRAQRGESQEPGHQSAGPGPLGTEYPVASPERGASANRQRPPPAPPSFGVNKKQPRSSNASKDKQKHSEFEYASE